MISGILSSAVSGLSLNAQRVGAAADNIANVSTTAYKRTDIRAQTIATRQSTSAYAPGGVQAIARPQNGVQGLLISRASSTDLAIAGAGFFPVTASLSSTSPQGATGDESLFTRDGSFAADNRGYLVNSTGHLLLANKPDGSGGLSPVNIDIQGANTSAIEIATDGRVTAVLDSGERRDIARIPVATFTNPEDLSAETGGAYRATDASGAPTYQVGGSAGAGQVQSGALEQSTTDLGTEFANLIVAETSYRASLKVLEAADQLSQSLLDETA